MPPRPHQGWHAIAHHLASPNFDHRPPKAQIDAVIIHAISLPPDIYGGRYIENFFCNSLNTPVHPYFNQISELRVSAHFLISRSGKCTQFVSTLDRAWHAGLSCLDQQDNVNDFSIGIELEGSDSSPFCSKQYNTLISLTKELQNHYPLITPERIVGHADIAPGRKTDPGPHFDWLRYRQDLQQSHRA